MENIMSDKFLYWPLWLNQPILSYQYMPVCVYVFALNQSKQLCLKKGSPITFLLHWSHFYA